MAPWCPRQIHEETGGFHFRYTRYTEREGEVLFTEPNTAIK